MVLMKGKECGGLYRLVGSANSTCTLSVERKLDAHVKKALRRVSFDLLKTCGICFGTDEGEMKLHA